MNGFQTWNVRSVLSHVHMPTGFAVNIAFKEYSCGHYLKETLIGRFQGETGRMPTETAIPGPHAFDGSYTMMTVSWCGMEMCIESVQEDDMFVLVVTPIKQQVRPAMCVLEGGILWGRQGYVVREDGALVAKTQDGEIRFHTTGEEMTDDNIPVQTAFLSVKLDKPVVFSTGRSVALKEAMALIQMKKEALHKSLLTLSTKQVF